MVRADRFSEAMILLNPRKRVRHVDEICFTGWLTGGARGMHEAFRKKIAELHHWHGKIDAIHRLALPAGYATVDDTKDATVRIENGPTAVALIDEGVRRYGIARYVADAAV